MLQLYLVCSEETSTMTMETLRKQVRPEQAGKPLSKSDLEFLRAFRKARQILLGGLNFSGLNALMPRIEEMGKDGTWGRLRPYVDQIVRETVVKNFSLAKMNPGDVHGEIKLGEAGMEELDL